MSSMVIGFQTALIWWLFTHFPKSVIDSSSDGKDRFVSHEILYIINIMLLVPSMKLWDAIAKENKDFNGGVCMTTYMFAIALNYKLSKMKSLDKR